jgi:uncharacterized protein (DUF2267 family)
MVLKGVYVDGWKFDKAFNRISHLADFLDEVRYEDGEQGGHDFGNNATARIAVAAVFKALNYFVSEGEMNDVIDIMPDELKTFIRESIAGEETVF